MELRDAISLISVIMMVYLAIRVQALQQRFSLFSKRFDLLHTARYRCLEEADDKIAEVQVTMFDTWVRTDAKSTDWLNYLPAFHAASKALRTSQVKASKYFGKDFNEAFLELGKAVHRVDQAFELYRLDPPTEDPAYKSPKRVGLNETVRNVEELIPPFRQMMAHMLQHELEEAK